MRVFISYARAEWQSAQRLADALTRAAIDVFIDRDLTSDEDWTKRLRTELRTRDIVVWLPSMTERSDTLTRSELRELDLRGVELVVAILDDADLPPALQNRTVVDIGTDFDVGVRQLIEHVRTTSQVDFSRLTPHVFEDLVVDLLRAMNFDVDQTRGGPDSGIDVYATHQHTDSTGSVENETWLQRLKVRGLATVVRPRSRVRFG